MFIKTELSATILGLINNLSHQIKVEWMGHLTDTNGNLNVVNRMLHIDFVPVEMKKPPPLTSGVMKMYYFHYHTYESKLPWANFIELLKQ